MSDQHQQVESSALRIGMAGNLTMGVAGVAASILSNSQALLVDGLFSLIGLFSAIVAVQVGKNAAAPPDKDRPLGYAADEAAFTTFRSLSLLGLVSFALVNAIAKIAAYLGGTVPPPVKFEVVGVYTLLICLICAGLWFNYHRSWKKTEKSSDIMKLEARAAAFDGALTGCAGLGFGLIFLLQGTSFSAVAPIGDSIIVLVLCFVASSIYWTDFKNSLGELLGSSAGQEVTKHVEGIVADPMHRYDMDLVDVAVLKTGRTLSVALFADPKRMIDGKHVDDLSLELHRLLEDQFARVQVLVVISQRGRNLFETAAKTPAA